MHWTGIPGIPLPLPLILALAESLKSFEAPGLSSLGSSLSLLLAESIKILGAPGTSSLHGPGLRSSGVSSIGSGLGILAHKQAEVAPSHCHFHCQLLSPPPLLNLAL